MQKETTKEMIVRKLTSRKFWLSVASFITMVMIANGASEASATQLTSIIMAGASVLAYILAEGLTDAGGTDNGDQDIAYGVPYDPAHVDPGIVAGPDGVANPEGEEIELDGQEFECTGTDIDSDGAQQWSDRQ